MTLFGIVRWLAGRFRGAAAVVAACLALAASPAPAEDQNFGLDSLASAKVKPGEQMLVESDQLVYDYDNNTVSAVGNVKIYYAGYTLEAEKVTYIKSTGKLIASGRVKLTDPTGVVAYAEDIDITDDFRDGFVQSLRVDTPDKTHFAAESAERAGGERTTFINGVYTACEPCKDHPERPPLWQVKAAKIIVDQKAKMIYFHDASFEFKGVPIAWIPYFSTADPSVKRKTGFLAPTFGYADSVGWSVTTPYFIALAPNYDLTITPSYYSKQGFLGQLEWRQRFANGQFSLQMAGISQDDPEAFLRYNDKGLVSGGTYAQRTFRGGVRTTGEFDINRWWSFGWDGTLTTDRTFTRNYGVLTQDSVATTSNVHLTGLRDKNYFDARIEYFQILADKPTEVFDGQPTAVAPKYDQDRQAVITPVIDHNYIFANPVLGGELSLNTNLTSLSRNEDDPFSINGNTFYHGLAGSYTRVSSELGWQKKLIGPVGTVFTPFASIRGDAFSLDPSGATASSLLTPDSTPTRTMAAAGIEASWPVMATAGASTHVIEPIAQLIVRPDEQLAGKLPHDDAPSLGFDDTHLFSRDKFSGYDRVEGGTRLNAGIRYTGTFANGFVVSGIFGQSYALAGKNSFADPDLSDVGAFSGLETDRSDYVGRISLDNGSGTRLTLRGRFDDSDFTINASQAEIAHTIGGLTASANYLYVRQIPEAGIDTATSQITTSASLTFVENWRVFGSAVFDLDAAYLSKDTLGIAFDNSCLSLSLAYSEVRGTDIPDQTLMVRVLLRTLAEGNFNANISSASSTN